MSLAAIQQNINAYYNRLPANLSNQVATSFIGSFLMGALSSGKLTPTLMNGATGAMLALIGGAVDPVLRDYILPQNPAAVTQTQRQQFWLAKCVVTLAATAFVAPVLASLFGITLKINLVWTAVFCILPMVRDAWTNGADQVTYNLHPVFIAASEIVPKMGRFRTF
jgi:hypothetical protein